MQTWLQKIFLLLIISAFINNAAFAQTLFTANPERTFDDFILKKDENVQDKISSNIFIKVVADKSACFVGEPVVVTYKLYTRLKSESNIVKNPSFNGFSVIDLPQADDNRYVSETLNGRKYNVYTLRRAQLYPLQPGTMELEAMIVENDIRFIKEGYVNSNVSLIDMNGNIAGWLPAEAMVDEKKTLQNKPVLITVKALPEDKKPPSFNGAVGNFTINAEVEKNYLTAGDAGKLRITVSGAGNLTLVNPPELLWPPGVETFEPAVKDKLNRLSVPVSGDKTFEYTFNIDKKGSYLFSAVEYSFFDPVAKKYRTVSTRPVTINVVKGADKKSVQPAAADTMTEEDFFEMLFTKRWLIIVPVALLILTGLLVWLRADKKRQRHIIAEAVTVKKEIEIPADAPLKNPLAKTEILLPGNNAGAFYEALNRELCNFLAGKLELPPEMMNKKNIAERLESTGISQVVSMAIQDLLDDISLQLYTPFAEENRMQDFYDRAIVVVQVFGV